MCKSVQKQIKANQGDGTADPIEDLPDEHFALKSRQAVKVEERIKRLFATGAVLAETAAILRSVPGTGSAPCAMPVAEMPELGRTAGEQAADREGQRTDAGETDDRRRSPSASTDFALYRACRLNPQQGLEDFADRLRNSCSAGKRLQRSIKCQEIYWMWAIHIRAAVQRNASAGIAHRLSMLVTH